MIKQKITFATTNDMNSDSDISTKISKYIFKKNPNVEHFSECKKQTGMAVNSKEYIERTNSDKICRTRIHFDCTLKDTST